MTTDGLYRHEFACGCVSETSTYDIDFPMIWVKRCDLHNYRPHETGQTAQTQNQGGIVREGCVPQFERYDP